MWRDCKRGGCSDTKRGSNSLTFPLTGWETVVVGEVHENMTLRCGNISEARGLVTWYRNDSEPIFLLSSNSSRPPAKPRFSLVNASSLHIEAVSLEDEGNYTCWEALNETRWFQVWLQVASKWSGRALGLAGEVHESVDRGSALESVAWASFWALPPAS